MCNNGMAIACHVSKLPGSLSSEPLYFGKHDPTIQLTLLETHDRKNEFCFKTFRTHTLIRAQQWVERIPKHLGDDVNDFKIHFSQLIWHSCRTFTLKNDAERTKYYDLVYLVRSEGDLIVIHFIDDDPPKKCKKIKIKK
jgi:hypothetical protein